VLAIPAKRHRQTSLSYLSPEEIEALLAAPDRRSWLGRRDHALLQLALQTGLRLSELIRLRVRDAVLTTSGAHARCLGKGRKERCTTLTRESVAVLRAWLTERQGEPDQPLFPTRQGAPLSRDAIEQLAAKHAAAAAADCPSLAAKRVTPHLLRPATRCCFDRPG
jgi:site-specific recombinase XerD